MYSLTQHECYALGLVKWCDDALATSLGKGRASASDEALDCSNHNSGSTHNASKVQTSPMQKWVAHRKDCKLLTGNSHLTHYQPGPLMHLTAPTNSNHNLFKVRTSRMQK